MNHNWEKVLLKPTDSLQQAIKTINEGSLRIAMVVSPDKTLLGTITDGDIRRALLNYMKMESPVSEIMHQKPTTARENDSQAHLLSLMKSKGLLHIPILNAEKQLIGIETIHHLIESPQYNNPVLLMAGGFGTRLHPLTKDTPKPLLKVGRKPILETILQQFISAGFKNFYISTYYKAEMIRDYFGDGSQWDISIQYTEEEKPMGTAGALGLLPHSSINDSLIVMNGDILTKVNFENLLSFHQQQGSIATMCVREYEYQVPYGIIETHNQRITKIAEKPIYNYFVNAGIYVLEPELLKQVKDYDYLDMPSLIEQQLRCEKQVSSFPIYEYWLDIGRMEEFTQAQQDVLRM